jgi:hypothetical protein
MMQRNARLTDACSPFHGKNYLGLELIVILDDTWIPILLDGANLLVHHDASMTVP